MSMTRTGAMPALPLTCRKDVTFRDCPLSSSVKSSCFKSVTGFHDASLTSTFRTMRCSRRYLTSRSSCDRGMRVMGGGGAGDACCPVSAGAGGVICANEERAKPMQSGPKHLNRAILIYPALRVWEAPQGGLQRKAPGTVPPGGY